MPVTVTPFVIGEDKLFGLQHAPAGGVKRKIAVVVLNSGLLPASGPFRLFVDLCEVLAEQGYLAIRIDQSGKGESPARPVASHEAQLLDYSAVLEHASKYGIEQIVLVGLCSGADDALTISLDRDSIHGMILLDGYAPKTINYHLHRYASAVLDPGRIWRFLRRTTAKLGSNDERETLVPVSLREWGEPPQMIRRFRRLLDRGCNIFAVFTGGMKGYYNHAGQLTAAVGSHARLKEVFRPAAEHIYPDPDHRQELIGSIVEWLSELPEGQPE